MNVLPKAFLPIILAAKWLVPQPAATTFAFPSFIYPSSMMADLENVLLDHAVVMY